MVTRKFVDEDLSAIERINPFAAVQINYDKGILKENVVCAVKDGDIVGVGFLILHQTLEAQTLKITFSTYMDKDCEDSCNAESVLIDGLIKRFEEIKKEKIGVNVYLRSCFESDELEDIQELLNKGFSINDSIPVLKYDLSQDVVHYEIPADITIQKFEFNETNMKEYLTADALASSGMDAETDLWFNTGDPSFTCYTAMCGDKIVGAVSIWNISEEHGVTENIFVIPEYRRKNIARELIATALDLSKARGLKIVTLSVLGTNSSAIKLYMSAGYKMFSILVEMLYK